MKIKDIKLIRTAMPVPMPTPQERRRMMEEGIGVSPHVPHAKHTKEELPNTGKKELAEIIKNAAEGFFSSLSDTDKKTVMQLPAIHQLDPDMLVDIDGQNYYVVQIAQSESPKKSIIRDGVEYKAGQTYPGKIVCLKADTGEVVQFPFQGTVEKIKQPLENKQRIMQNMNTEIAAYNKKLETIEKASHTSRLALQIQSAEQDVNERLETINRMIDVIQQKQDNPTQSQGHTEWMERLFDDVRNRRMSLLDAFHTISYQYQNRPEQLVSDIESGTLDVPQEIRQALLAMATQEARNKQQEANDERQESANREVRKQEEWIPEGGIEEHPLPFVTQDDIPGGDYKRLPAYSRPENINNQTIRQLTSLTNDRQEITATKESLTGLRQYIGALEKSQRSNEFLSSPEGQTVIQNVLEQLNNIKQFVKRYKTNLFEDGKINSKLFGTSGKAMGNALLAVSLNKILNVIYETIKPFIQPDSGPDSGTPSVAPTTTPVVTPTEETVRQPVTSMFNLSTKTTKISMSKSLWDRFLDLYNRVD